MKRGFTLVELMIAMLIGSLLMLGAYSLLTGSKEGARIQDELARTQENARFAAEFIARDLRQAGYFGCRPELELTSTLNSPTDWRWDLSRPVQGFVSPSTFPSQFNTSAAVPAFSSVNHQPDALAIKRVNADQAVAIATEVQGALTLHHAHSFSEGQILLAANCHRASLFQVSADNAGSTSLANTVVSAQVPGNCIGYLGATSCSTGALAGFSDNADVAPLVSRVYYVATGLSGVPGLYRAELGPDGNLLPEELVPGIEDFVIWFGQDTDSDGVANRYVRANASGLDFTQVVAVRISLLLRTLQQPDTVAKPYSFNGVSVTPSDGHVRRNLTMTVVLRNRT